MKIVLVEDETPALEKLERYVLKYNPSFEIVASLSSVKEAVKWFSKKNNAFDIIFMDIQLTDGLSFEIFNQVKILKPVIFTTAFDEYALDAFKVNSIDYILKPITFTDLSRALYKFEQVRLAFETNPNIEVVAEKIVQKKIKDRFLVRLGNHIHSIKSEEIALFFAEGRTVYLVTNENKKFIIDYRLEDLIQLLDERKFFRVNRTFIVNISSIKDVIVYSNSRLKISPIIRTEKDIVVSREKVNSFKNWFEGI